ncbi:MAG: C40 family peptidase [Rectinemataceae bacterium]
MYRFLILVAAVFLGMQAATQARAIPGELPLPTLSPSRTRDAILRSADRLKGTPYVFGGESAKGLDCSGFVFLVFKQATGHAVPRTVDSLGQWVLMIPRKELKAGDLVFFELDRPATQKKTSAAFSPSAASAADHVGIYTGDGQFLHAASAGSRTGVIRNSLSEPAWSKRFLFAGRIVSASPLSGLAFEAAMTGVLDAEALLGDGSPDLRLRGGGISFAATLPVMRNFSFGLRSRIEWDELLGTLRIPLELVIGQNTGFSIFVGPALTLGEPGLPATESSPFRGYSAPASWIASAGLRWSSPMIRSGASGAGLFSELRFSHYLPLPDLPEDPEADRRATISLGIGLRFRSTRY